MHECSTFAGSSQQQLHKAMLAGMRHKVWELICGQQPFIQISSGRIKYCCKPCTVKPDRLGLHGRACKLQVEGQQVGGQEKNGQQYRVYDMQMCVMHGMDRMHDWLASKVVICFVVVGIQT